MPPPARPGRRTVLAAGLGAVLGLSGCSHPTPGSGPGGGSGADTGGGNPHQTGSPDAGQGGPTGTTPLAGAAAGVAVETRLAGLAVGILAKGGNSAPSARQRLILGQIRDAHLAHITVLRSPDPSRPEPAGTLAPPAGLRVPSQLDDAIRALAAQETAAARAHQTRMTAADASTTLIWASLTAAAQSYATALTDGGSRSSTPLGRQRRALAELTAAQAQLQLVAQVDACLYGYQAALAKLSGSRFSLAGRRISSYYRLRNTLTAQIVAGHGRPPAAAPAYLLDPEPTGSASAARLAAALESRIQPYLGQWLRTATGTGRSAAFSALTAATQTGLDFGGPINRWPGWPS